MKCIFATFTIIFLLSAITGKSPEIAYFVPVETPFTVALLLDTSGSTFLRLEDIQASAIAFFNQLRAVDQGVLSAPSPDLSHAIPVGFFQRHAHSPNGRHGQQKSGEQ